MELQERKLRYESKTITRIWLILIILSSLENVTCSMYDPPHERYHFISMEVFKISTQVVSFKYQEQGERIISSSLYTEQLLCCLMLFFRGYE